MSRLLAADDSVLRLTDKRGKTPADKARRGGHTGIAAALDRWAAGDHAGALADLEELATVSKALWEAVVSGEVDEVSRLAPQAARLGVISKVQPTHIIM